MKYHVPTVLAGSSLLVLASTFAVQAQVPQRAADTVIALEEVIVTARRKEESLQDIPQTVTAITAQSLEDLNILRFNDLDKVVSGLQLQPDGGASMRGVTFNRSTAAAATVASYVNDAVVTSAVMANALFDTGQIEFLRGPQGTTRGVSAPSGAIHMTTHRVNLGDFGGSVKASANDLDGHNVEGAFNVPIIKDMLGIRLAGLEDVTDNGGVHSVHNGKDPSSKTQAGRITIRLEPNDTVSAVLMYQNMNKKDISYTQVVGTGAPGLTNVNAQANFNGPSITRDDLLSVQDRPSVGKTLVELATAQLNWSVVGHKLSYVGGYMDNDFGGSFNALDTANYLPGYEPIQYNETRNTAKSHELRLASEERLAGMFDYVVGVFDRSDTVAQPPIGQAVAYLAGAFGAPGTPTTAYSPYSVNRRYESHALINFARRVDETSFFANGTAHLLDDKLEISAGARHIDSKNVTATSLRATGPAAYIGAGDSAATFNSVGAIPAANCLAAGGQTTPASPYGAGICEINTLALVQLGVPQGVFRDLGSATLKHKTWIWDASVAYDITPDLMTYVHAGSSWREGPLSAGIQNTSSPPDPTLTSVTFHEPEKSESYEIGLKWSFLERRGRLNVDYYIQEYDNLILGGQSAYYYIPGTAPNVTRFTFTTGVPAEIQGADLDVGLAVTDNWSVSGNVSWAEGKVKNGIVPCSDGDFNGVPDTLFDTTITTTAARVAAFQAAGQSLALCPFSGSTLQAPEWNANLQSEVGIPLFGFEAFVRGLVNYQPSWTNANTLFEVPGYYLANLFVGVRDPNRKWDVTLYGNNITNTHKQLSNGNPITGLPVSTGLPGSTVRSTGDVFGPSGYSTAGQFTPRREYGLILRYNFGGG